MELVSVEVKPYKESVDPAIRLDITLRYTKGIETLIGLEGRLLSEGKVVSHLSYLQDVERTPTEFGVSAKTRDSPERPEFTIPMVAFLSEKSLNYLEDVREKNAKKEIKLNLELIAKIITSNTVISTLHLLREDFAPNVRFPLPDSKLIYYKWVKDYTPELMNMWILSGDNEPTFLKVLEVRLPWVKGITISSGEWVVDYAPLFGIGKFAMFELPILEEVKIKGDVANRVKEAIKSLERIKKDFIDAEWNKVIEDSRPIFELVRDESFMGKLLERDGYSNGAKKELLDSINNLFHFSSKFIHRIDPSGKEILPETKASKEDAYLIYTTAISLVNLFARKLKRYEEH